MTTPPIGRMLGIILITLSFGSCESQMGTEVDLEGDLPSVADLTAVSVFSNAVMLRWTQVENETGGAVNYAVRYGSPTIEWDDAASTEAAVSGTEPGEELSYIYMQLESDTEYEFQVLATLGDANGKGHDHPGSTSNKSKTKTKKNESGVTTVSASPSNHTFRDVGETVQLSATAWNSDGKVVTGAELVWSSSDSTILNVDDAGLATALAAGEAMITVAGESYEAVDTVTAQVSPKPQDDSDQVASITVSPSSHTFTRVGQTVQIVATARNGAGEVIDGTQLAWASSDPSIVSVNDMGTLTARAVGTAMVVVSAVCCDLTDSVHVSVPHPAGALFFDDFESYSVGSRISGGGGNGFAWTGGGGSGSNVSTVTDAVSLSGSKSLEIFYGANTANLEVRFSFPRVQEHWTEFYLYFPDGTEGLGSGAYDHLSDGPSNNKLYAVWAEDYGSTPRGFLNFYPAGSPTVSRVRLDRTDYELDGVARPISGGVGSADFIFEDDLRTWARFRIHFKLSDIGESNGIMRVWKNDSLMLNVTDDTFGDHTASRNYLRNGYLMGWRNTSLPYDFKFFMDNFAFYTSDPGW